MDTCCIPEDLPQSLKIWEGEGPGFSLWIFSVLIRCIAFAISGSEEEVNDLKAAYVEYKGDMDMILDNVLCCTVDDENRFRQILEPAIKAKQLPTFKKFKETEAKKKVRQRKVRGECITAVQLPVSELLLSP